MKNPTSDRLIEEIQHAVGDLLRSALDTSQREILSRLSAGLDTVSRNSRELTARNEELLIQAERAVEERDAVLEAIGQWVLIYDAEGRVIRANRAAKERMNRDIIGLSREMLIRRVSFRYPDGRAVSVEDLPSTRAARGEIVRNEKMEIVDSKGETYHVRVSSSPLIFDNRLFVTISVLQDCTEDVLTIRKLDEERARLSAIIESVPEAIVVVDEDSRVRMANPVADSIYGWHIRIGEEHASHADLHICYPDENPCAPADLPLIRSVRHGEVIRGMELPVLRPDGGKREVLANSAPITDSAGRRIGAVAVVQDITERKEAERALRSSEERFRGIFERAGFSIVLADTGGRIVRANPAFQKILGYGADELEGVNIGDLTHPDDLTEALTHFRETLAGEHEIDHLEKRYLAKDGRTVWGRLATSLLRDPGGEIRYVIGMIEDITDRKAYETLRSRAFEQIEQNMEQFAILGDHVRHPLQVILARADLMEDTETAEKIRGQVLRINGIVKQLDRGWVESRLIREFLRRNEMA